MLLHGEIMGYGELYRSWQEGQPLYVYFIYRNEIYAYTMLVSRRFANITLKLKGSCKKTNIKIKPYDIKEQKV